MIVSGHSVQKHQLQIIRLSFPQTSNMDFHIGAALWFAARGQGHRSFTNNAENEKSARKVAANTANSPCWWQRTPGRVEEDEAKLIAYGPTTLGSEWRSFISRDRRPTPQVKENNCARDHKRSTISPSAGVRKKSKPSRVVCRGLSHGDFLHLVSRGIVRHNKSGGATKLHTSQPLNRECRRIAKPRCTNGLCKICCQKIQTLLCVLDDTTDLDAGKCTLKDHCSARRSSGARPPSQIPDSSSETKPLETPQSLSSLFWSEEGTNSEAANNNLHASGARVLFSGLGADEHLGGYGRHRTAFRTSGWGGLQKELELDVSRLWQRNLGRDDRCMSHHGKEVRFPFLDEDLSRFLQDCPVADKCNPNLPPGTGDKLILRAAALLMGFDPTVVHRTKRAIQFGSRISKRMTQSEGVSIRQSTGTSAYTLRGLPTQT